MQFGFSSYSFNQRLSTGEMTLFDVIDWIAQSQGEHLELAVLSGGRGSVIPTPDSDPDYVRSIKDHAAEAGVTLSNMSVGAEFFADPSRVDDEVERVKRYVDLANDLGISLLRHDVAHRNEPGDDVLDFEEALPLIARASREIAQYASQFGITTSLENHGFFVQGSERVRRVVHAVAEPNFKTTLDVGNFLCVDEDPFAAVTNNLPYASIVHFKDFYVRPHDQDPGQGWLRSRSGKHLRGAIVGQGDIDMRSIVGAIAASDFDGFVSIEFEGQEDCLAGCEQGISNAIQFFNEAESKEENRA